MLCFRCEHRAKFLENGDRPRFECGQIENSVVSCYMYQPVKPVTLEKAIKDDKRSVFNPPMLAARSIGSKEGIEMRLTVKIENGKHLLYWIPNE